MILILIGCIVLLLFAIIYYIVVCSITNGKGPLDDKNSDDEYDYLSVPVYMTEEYLNKIIEDGIKITRKIYCKNTVIELTKTNVTSIIKYEKNILNRDKVHKSTDKPKIPDYINRVRNFIENYVNEMSHVEPDIGSATDGLNDYTKLKHITSKGVDYILFIQPDLLLHTNDVYYNKNYEFKDKIQDFIDMYETVYGIKISGELEYYKLSEDKSIYVDNLEENDREEYKKFMNNIIKHCYKLPCFKQKYHIDIFKVKNKIVEHAFRQREDVTNDHIDLLTQIETFIDNELFNCYYTAKRPELSVYHSYIRLDSHFKVYAEYIPNVGNTDTRVYELSNIMPLNEFIYALSYPNFNKNYNPPIMYSDHKKHDLSIPVKGGNKSYSVVNEELEKISGDKNNVLINAANAVLVSKPKVIFVGIAVGNVVEFVTISNPKKIDEDSNSKEVVKDSNIKEYHYFKFVVTPDYDFSSKQYREIVNSSLFIDCITQKYYRVNTKVLPYSLLKFYKLTKASTDKLHTMTPAYLHKFITAPLILPIIPKAIFGIISANYTDGKENYKTIRKKNFTYIYVNTINVSKDQPSPNENFKIKEFEENTNVLWVVNNEVYDIVKSGKVKFGDKYEYNVTLLKDIEGEDIDELLDELKSLEFKYQDYTLTAKIIYSIGTSCLHFKHESNKNPYFIILSLEGNQIAVRYRHLFYDNIREILKLYPTYYKRFKTVIPARCNLFIYLNYKYSGRLNVVGKGSNKYTNSTDNDIVSSFNNLFDISLEQFNKGCALYSAAEFINKFPTKMTPKMTKIVEYIKTVYTQITGLRFGVQLYSGIKNRIMTSNYINDIGSSLVVSSRCSTLCNFDYREKIDFLAIMGYKIEYERARKYQDEVLNKYSNKFNNFYGSFYDPIEYKLSKYKVIAIEKFALDVEIKKDGIIISYEILLTIINMSKKLLDSLDNGGDYLIRTNVTYPTSVFKRFVEELMNSFERINFTNSGHAMYIYCYGYNGKYKEFEIFNVIVNNKYFGNTIKTLEIPAAECTNAADHFAKMLDTAIRTYFTTMEYYSYNEPTEDYCYKLLYNELKEVIKLMDEYNIPYDKYYASLVTKYDEVVYKKLLTLNSPINSSIVNYNGDYVKITPNCDFYHYEYDFGIKYLKLNKMYDLIDSGFESTAETRKIYQDFTRGINKYLDDKHIFKIKASNAFVKLWEIYHTHKVLNKKGVNAFHMCEAPGQWIRTTDEFIKIVFDGQIDYKWMANSLNPYNKSNIAKYGKDIISDTYQLMKTYRNQWVFGPHGDDTGDITKPNIIKWYREKFKDKSLNLITGDAGLPTDMPLVYLQKLDYAQCVLTLAVASKGANCVIKCFSPYMKNNPKTLKSTGFFVNLMYLYALHFKNVYLYKPYASRPQSGEFYIVGKKFVDVKDETIDLLLNVLDNFNENQVFIEKNNIPDNFERLVQDFLNRLVNYNIESIEVGFFINQCVMDENNTFGFQDVIKNYDKIQNKRFEAFCEKFSILELE